MNNNLRTPSGRTLEYNPDYRYVSYSQVQMFQSCPYKWQLQYERNIRPVQTDLSLELGTLMHAGVAAILLNQEPETGVFELADRTSPQWRDYLDNPDMEENAVANPNSFTIGQIAALQTYQLVIKALPLLERFQAKLLQEGWGVVVHQGMPMVEFPINRHLDGDLWFHGVVDAVLKEKDTGMVWVVDFKFREQIQTDTSDDYETQTALYAQSLREMGIKVDGSLIYQVCTRLPAEPTMNQPTKTKPLAMSRADIFTDWDTYRAALIREGIEPAEYEDMRLKLVGKKFYHQSRTYRSVLSLDRAWAEFVENVSYMLDSLPLFEQRHHRNGHAPRRISSFSCPRCPMQAFCMQEYNGQDASTLIGTQYQKSGD